MTSRAPLDGGGLRQRLGRGYQAARWALLDAPWSGTLLLTTAIFLWGTAYRAHAVGAEHSPGIVFAFLRAAPAAALLFGVAVAFHGSAWRNYWRSGVITGILMVAIALGGIAEAIPRAGAANAAIIFNAFPLLVGVMAWWLLRERLTMLGVAGLAVGFTGLYVLVGPQLSSPDDAGDLRGGMGLAAAAACAWAIGTVTIAKLARKAQDFEVVSFTAVQHVGGAAVLLAFVAVIPGRTETDWDSVELWAAASWVVVGSSVLASLAFYAALRRVSATRASAWQFLVPVVAVGVEAVLGRAPSRAVLGGMFLSVLGVLLVTQGTAPGLRARQRMRPRFRRGAPPSS